MIYRFGTGLSLAVLASTSAAGFFLGCSRSRLQSLLKKLVKHAVANSGILAWMAGVVARFGSFVLVPLFGGRSPFHLFDLSSLLVGGLPESEGFGALAPALHLALLSGEVASFAGGQRCLAPSGQVLSLVSGLPAGEELGPLLFQQCLSPGLSGFTSLQCCLLLPLQLDLLASIHLALLLGQGFFTDVFGLFARCSGFGLRCCGPLFLGFGGTLFGQG